MGFRNYRHGIEVIQRGRALRIASSYRAVSGPVVLVIVYVVPMDLFAFEQKRMYDQT